MLFECDSLPNVQYWCSFSNDGHSFFRGKICWVMQRVDSADNKYPYWTEHRSRRRRASTRRGRRTSSGRSGQTRTSTLKNGSVHSRSFPLLILVFIKPANLASTYRLADWWNGVGSHHIQIFSTIPSLISFFEEKAIHTSVFLVKFKFIRKYFPLLTIQWKLSIQEIIIHHLWIFSLLTGFTKETI